MQGFALMMKLLMICVEMCKELFLFTLGAYRDFTSSGNEIFHFALSGIRYQKHPFRGASYPSRRLGISSAVRRYIIKGGLPPLYLITP